MKKEILIVYDEDEEYIRAFSEYVNNLSNATFSVAIFTELEAMLQFIKNQVVRIILLPDKLLCAEILELNIQIMLLSDDAAGENHYEFNEVWKYQSGSNIIREISRYCAECKEFSSSTTGVNKGNKVKIIGVYSPIHRCGATSFAIATGILTSEYRRTLYINMEEFSGLRELFKCEYTGDLSDLMYFYIQGGSDMAMRLNATVHTYQNMDYIPPMVYTVDLRNIDMKTWLSFIQGIGSWSNYEVIVLDMSSMLPNVAELFEICDVVFVPWIKGVTSENKLKEFKEYIQSSDYHDYYDKLRFFEAVSAFLNDEKYSILELYTGQYKEFVRNLVWDVIDDE